MRNHPQPKFPLHVDRTRAPSVALARQQWAAWSRHPRQLTRPVLIFSGWMVPHWWVSSVHSCLVSTTVGAEDRLHRITCDASEPLPQLGRRVAEQFGHDEVDVV